MIELLLLMLFNSLYIVGVYLATGQDMVFERPARWIESKIPYWITKPLFNCPTCMASVHSILPFWMTYEVSKDTVMCYVLYVFALAATSTFMANKITGE